MSNQSLEIQPLIGSGDVTREDINRVITDLNASMTQISESLKKITGADGQQPEFDNDLDLKGNALVDVGDLSYRRNVRLLESTRKTLAKMSKGAYSTGSFANVDIALSELADAVRDISTVLRARGVIE